MVYWNSADRFKNWNNSGKEYEITSSHGDGDDKELELDMSMTSEGNLVNTVAILLAMVDNGIITTEEFVEYQIQAREALGYGDLGQEG
jgi:hypothetical protein